MNGGIDVIDTDNLTAHVVCALECIDVKTIKPIMPPSMSPLMPTLQPVDESIEVPVVQIRTEWDSVTDVLMYESVDMDVHTEESDY